MIPKIIEIKNRDPEMLTLTWVINNICNNSCSYCPDELHSGTNHDYTWENARRFIELLFQRYTRIHCAIAGGEPTMSPHLLEMCRMFREHDNIVGFTTNGVANKRRYQELAKLCNYICISFHPATQPESSFDEFIDKAREIGEHCWCHISVMTPSSNFDHSVKFYNYLREHPGKYSAELVRITSWGVPDNYDHIYSDSQLIELDRLNSLKIDNNIRNRDDKSIDDHDPLQFGKDIDPKFDKSESAVIDFFGTNLFTVNDLISRNMTYFQGWECNIGLESLFVRQGRIKRGNCSVGDFIGHIDDLDNIQWPESSIICDQSRICHCPSDVRITKRML